MSKTKLWFMFLGKIFIIVGATLAVAQLMDRIVINRGESVPGTIFFSQPSKTASLGDYVILKAMVILNDRMAKTPVFLKRVSCDSGQFIESNKEGVICNGEKLGEFVVETMEGKPLKPWIFKGTIPEGMAFVSGTHHRSYDSRYFGLMEKLKLTVVKKVI